MAVSPLFASELRLEARIDGSFVLLREEVPFVFQGAGGETRLPLLKACGANALRTWGSDQTEAVIDEAGRLGLELCAGLWIEHERHGADYRDPERFAREVEKHCRAVDRFKDKPALALWAVGNEVETLSTNDRVWEVIEAVAAYIRRVDPRHPVMTVTAHVSPKAVQAIRTHCPSVQLLGCNSYAGLRVLADDLRSAGWHGPYLVTEWGNDGNWEVNKTPWGAELEPSSAEKAVQFEQRQALLLADRGRCLGGFAFYWGQKQEATATWFNLFTPAGERTEAVGVLARAWGGTVPQPESPRVGPLRLAGRRADTALVVRPGARLVAESDALPAAGVVERWVLCPESETKGLGGDREAEPAPLPLADLETAPGHVSFSAPSRPGAYRLYYYASAGAEAAGCANFPFLVR